jgi:hypothetical protein
MQCLYMVISVVIRINLHVAKTLSVLVPFTSHHRLKRVVTLFVAEV